MILLLGPPGAGKSVQGKLLASKYGYKHISMGRLLREKLEGELSEKLKRGEMINDKLVYTILSQEIIRTDHKQTIVLDGFPRHDAQVKMFLDFIKQDHRELKLMIHLKINEEISVERLNNRARMDDDESVVRSRYHLYQSEIVPMINHLKNLSYNLVEINGEQSIESVNNEIVEAINAN